MLTLRLIHYLRIFSSLQAPNSVYLEGGSVWHNIFPTFSAKLIESFDDNQKYWRHWNTNSYSPKGLSFTMGSSREQTKISRFPPTTNPTQLHFSNCCNASLSQGYSQNVFLWYPFRHLRKRAPVRVKSLTQKHIQLDNSDQISNSDRSFTIYYIQCRSPLSHLIRTKLNCF